MASNIQDILQRIEKLKKSLQEKNTMLEERDRIIAQLRDSLEGYQKQAEINEKEISDLKSRESSTPNTRSEAFLAAERVEAITKLQREAQALREENRALKSAAKEVAARESSAKLTSSMSLEAVVVPSVPDVSKEELDGYKKKIVDRDREITALKEEVETIYTRYSELKKESSLAIAPPLPASESAHSQVKAALKAREQDVATLTRKIEDLNSQIELLRKAGPADTGSEGKARQQEFLNLQRENQLLRTRAEEADENDALVQASIVQIGDLESTVELMQREAVESQKLIAQLRQELEEREEVMTAQQFQILDLESRR